MGVMTENKVVPKLRFGEFQDDWETNKLNNIFTISVGGDVSKENVSKVKTEAFKYPIYANAKKEKGFYAYSDIYKIDSNVVTVAGRGVHLGIAHSRKERFFPIVRLLVLKPKYECDIDYFEHRINLIRLFVESTGVPQLTAPQISNYSVSFPSLPEQQKLASFLSAVDKKIQQLTKKKELLEEYKKGVMQKIFSQELRFKDDNGSSYPDWEEKKLGEIGEFKTSSVDKLSKEDEKMVSLVNYMNVYNHQNITNEITKDLMRVSAKEKQLETSDLKKGDILFTPSSETPSDIGHSIVIFEDLHNTLYSYHLMRFRPTINLDILFSHYFCNIPSVLRQITRFATGSTRFTISVGSFSKIIIQLPSLEEQVKIANFLSSLDSKIDLVSTQIENTKAFKKGLLQQMFV